MKFLHAYISCESCTFVLSPWLKWEGIIVGTERYVKRILSAYPELEHSRFWKPREGYGNAFEPEPCVQRIREAFPEFADAGYRYIEGGDHHIFLMNDRTAFRFV